MSVICKVDGKEFPSEKALHMSLKGYGLNKVKYYQTYFERRDLLTNELINFKTKEQYLNSDFNDKNNMKKWLSLIIDGLYFTFLGMVTGSIGLISTILFFNAKSKQA